MHISPTLMLTIATIAATLFIGVFAAAAVTTRRNRRIIRNHSMKSITDRTDRLKQQ